MCCSVLQCVAVCCSALQRVAVCCSVLLQCVAASQTRHSRTSTQPSWCVASGVGKFCGRRAQEIIQIGTTQITLTEKAEEDGRTRLPQTSRANPVNWHSTHNKSTTTQPSWCVGRGWASFAGRMSVHVAQSCGGPAVGLTRCACCAMVLCALLKGPTPPKHQSEEQFLYSVFTNRQMRRDKPETQEYM